MAALQECCDENTFCTWSDRVGGFCEPAFSASAPAYPTKPIRFIVPFPPGGGNDAMARAVGYKLGDVLGQQVIIDNRAGAGGVIGAETAAHSLPDGYTLFLGGVGSHG